MANEIINSATEEYVDIKVGSEKIRAEGVEATKADLVNGKVPESQLPNDEKMQTVFDELARMDAFTSTSTESDAFDVAITKLSELLGEDVSELAA